MLMSLIHRHTVIGHDRRCVCGKCCFKRQEVIIKILAWINLSLLKWKMRVKTFLLRTTAGKMLCHSGHAVGSQFLSLETQYICFRHFCGEGSIFTKCATDSWP